ncbi:abortive infection protein [Streptomyces sp. NPDC056503]|uniref:abortive infection protein n=1 Tax=Streptomyces sp. NPDC056503 TaxID=3345842 RepID=UPI0036A96411
MAHGTSGAQRPTPWRGVNYNTGTDYAGHGTAPVPWPADVVRAHMAAIRDELHCTSVSLYGTDVAGLADCARAAAEAGLHVWLQPRLIEGSAEATLAHLAEAAGAAEELRGRYGAVDLSVGCELTVFGSGIMPGGSHAERSALLAEPGTWGGLPAYSAALNELLGRALEVARARFGGRLTYAAGLWEDVAWDGFDFVGVNYYRTAFNADGYAEGLRRYFAAGKPVLVTEFGCCTFTGAAEMGPGGYAVIDWSAVPPRLRGDFTRDEPEQARALAGQLDVFDAAGVAGAYVFEFVAPKPYSEDPRFDLDMGSFGLVKVVDGGWLPKESFRELARRFTAR